MSTVTIYDPLTGQILETITSENPELLELNIRGRSYVDGSWSSNQYYIDNGKVVEKPADPTTLTEKYDFDFASKSWILNSDKTAQASRDYRNKLLEVVDRVNPVWYDSLSTQQKQALQAYRQALLAVPQQSGFPTDIDWPQQPDWL